MKHHLTHGENQYSCLLKLVCPLLIKIIAFLCSIIMDFPFSLHQLVFGASWGNFFFPSRSLLSHPSWILGTHTTLSMNTTITSFQHMFQAWAYYNPSIPLFHCCNLGHHYGEQSKKSFRQGDVFGAHGDKDVDFFHMLKKETTETLFCSYLLLCLWRHCRIYWGPSCTG